MAQALELHSDRAFCAEISILGCVAHVINLVANKGLATILHHSPQKTKIFQQTVALLHNGNGPLGATNLLIDVKTRLSYNYFCNVPEYSQYALNELEWDQITKMQSILQPLSDTTEFLCGSTYPTLNMVIPMYISLLKKLYIAQNTYNSAQMYKPVEKMIVKLDHYLKRALDKPAANCATILDP
ncbi:hypothetical protein PPACK8108_LOCUS19991 [Phakopsora pachyrhizi]|uniref:hAT-like transposase RNase-H fold domain-containing protein n=1 Tax=Phakopsora pachyrhizi TaxID=170000 RepID=A0AAV0BDX5_PHAPC|nr:hypothetical protein PPACK8108_LOCUS19991 [Phakopsora pachyrhizi]